MIRFLFVCSCFVVLVSGSQNRGNLINRFPTVAVNVSSAVTKAATWLLNERGTDNTWGTFTPRAIVALALAEDVFPLPQKEWDRMVKQLNILLSLELGTDGVAKKLNPSRLALFINALYATCQDPRNFHGRDLIHELRNLTDTTVFLKANNFSLPAIYLPLCFAGKTTHEDFRQLLSLYPAHKDKPDLRAIELMAMACISRQQFRELEPHYQILLQGFVEEFPFFNRNADVYTKALCLQALNSNGTVDVSSLASLQESSGSFGSLLATYHAIPALMNKNLLSLKNRRCQRNNFARETEAPLPDSSYSAPKVYYSIWIGEGVDMDTRTITVSNAANKSLFDVMSIAQKRNPMFKFNVDETDTGKSVYSIAGQPNDVERELYWALFLNKNGAKGMDPNRKNGRLMKIGVDRILPAPEDHFIFWFKRLEH